MTPQNKSGTDPKKATPVRRPKLFAALVIISFGLLALAVIRLKLAG